MASRTSGRPSLQKGVEKMATSLLCHGRKFGVDLIDAASQAYMGGLIEQDDSLSNFKKVDTGFV